MLLIVVNGRIAAMTNNFGLALKVWRARRNMSQLHLGAEANVSSRHIAFLETGRARPSRMMVGQLSDALSVPRSARNELLVAAGFSATYCSRALDMDEMLHVRAAMDWTLKRHDPYPGFALDRHWAIVAANFSGTDLLANVGLSVGDSLLTAMVENENFKNAIENWSVIARYMAARLRTESIHAGGDPVLDRASKALSAQAPMEKQTDPPPLPAIVATRVRVNNQAMSFFSTIAQFGTAEDIALADLRIELLFPADELTKKLLAG
jgi:transcriptional regulator with XRE-family HTH domain